MVLDRRLVVALVAIFLVLAPAAALRAFCVGHSCDEPSSEAGNIPFCSLPDGSRDAIVAGFREGRSPDILVVPRRQPGDRVPLVFSGQGIERSASIPNGTTLDAVAPTIANAIGLKRQHPEVRSGRPIDGLTTGERPALVVLIALPGVDAEALHGDGLDAVADIATRGLISTEASVGSHPIDPAAVLATLGTGGLPYQHGITGTYVRNDLGKLARAWGPGAPVSVIATLADDMDESLRQEPRIALVAASDSDRVLIGGNWYVDNDKDEIVVEPSPPKAAEAVEELLKTGFGRDEVPDLLAVSLVGSVTAKDRAIGRVVGSAEATAPGKTLVVIAGTGSPPEGEHGIVREIESLIPGERQMIEQATQGGFFVDQDALASTGTTEDEVIKAIVSTGAYEDVFAAITVEFARFC